MWNSAATATSLSHPVLAHRQVLLVQMAVAELTGVGLTEICGGDRGPPGTALARQLAMYLCHLVLAMSCSEVGRAFGRDRTTVSHAIHRIEDLREDPEFERQLLWLEATLRRAGSSA